MKNKARIPNGAVKFLTRSSFQTKKLGEVLAKRVLRIKNKKKAVILSLQGDLGGGKTTFLQGFARGLGIREKITSPTFVMMRKIKIKGQMSDVRYLIHIDCYRAKKPREVLSLGLKEIVQNPKNIVAIEWADKIKKFLPQEDIIMLKFNYAGKNARMIIISF